MIQVSVRNRMLRVLVSKNEKIDLVKAKKIFRKGSHIINQQAISRVEVELYNLKHIDKRTSEYINQVVAKYKKKHIHVINK